jgi:NAD(P)-dependent dehydrogenase (short-subunit alcohol dehydrogenase family)
MRFDGLTSTPAPEDVDHYNPRALDTGRVKAADESLFRLDGKTALVTGGGRGIGRAIALGFAAAGADVCVAARTTEEIELVAKEVRETGRRGMAVTVDLFDEAAIEALVSETGRGLGRINVLVNNAGAAPFMAPLHESRMEGWSKYLNLLLTSQASVAQKVVPMMLEQGGGTIVNVASIAGFRGGRGTSYYAAAKHGLIGLTRSMALELAQDGIRVNALCPGLVETNMSQPLMSDERTARIPMHRPGTPEEMVGPALFLASDASSYMTGQTVVVDGGQLA